MFKFKITTSTPPPNFNGQETTPADGDHSSGLRVVAQLPFTPLKGKSEGKLQSAAGERRKTRLLAKVLLEVWLSAQGGSSAFAASADACAPSLGAGGGSRLQSSGRVQSSGGNMAGAYNRAAAYVTQNMGGATPTTTHTHTEVTLQTVKSGAFI